MLSKQQKEDVEILIRHVGDTCIFPYFQNLDKADISYKESEIDPVTIADQQAEELLNQGLTDILPESLFLGEELFAKDKSILNHLNQSDKPVWVVDPIDGTDNFIEGKPGFGIMTCLVYQNEIIASWLYEVSSKNLSVYFADEGIYENGEKLQLESIVPTKPYSGMIGKKLHGFYEVQELKQASQDIILEPISGPSIVTYPQLFHGQIDFLIYKVTYPWDHLPGIAFLKHNNAVVSKWSGENFDFSDTHDGLVVARNQEVMDEVLDKIIAPLLKSKKIANMRSFKS